MAVVNEVITKFSFSGSTKPLSLFNADLGKGIMYLGGFSAAIGASLAVIAKWSDGILNALNPLILLSKQSGVATQYIQEMGYVAIASGSSLQAMEKTISSLSRKIGSATLNGNQDFSRLGISIRKASGEIKTADEILGEVGERFKAMNLSLSQQVTIAESLGIDSTLLEMLGKTSGRIKELREESKGFGVLTKKQTEQVEAYNRSVAKLRFNLDGMKMLIAVGLAPELDKLSKQFNSFLVDNKDSIVSGIGKFAKGLTEVMALLWRMKVPLMAIGAIIAVSIAPEIIAITAAVTALALLVDDLSMPMRGGESVVANKSLEVMHTINKPVDSMLGFMKNMFNGGGKVEQNVVVEVKSTDPERSAIEVRDKLQEHLEIAKALVQGGGM